MVSTSGHCSRCLRRLTSSRKPSLVTRCPLPHRLVRRGSTGKPNSGLPKLLLGQPSRLLEKRGVIVRCGAAVTCLPPTCALGPSSPHRPGWELYWGHNSRGSWGMRGLPQPVPGPLTSFASQEQVFMPEHAHTCAHMHVGTYTQVHGYRCAHNYVHTCMTHLYTHTHTCAYPFAHVPQT